MGEISDELDARAVSGEADSPFVKMVHKGTLLAVHSQLDLPAHGPADPYRVPSFGLGDIFVCAVQLCPIAKADIWRNGRHLGTQGFAEGSLQVFDLRHKWRAEMHPPFDSINFFISHAALDRTAEDANGAKVELYLPAIDPDRIDRTMLHLAQALAPSFRRPGELTALFADHLVAAAALHLASTYGSGERDLLKPRGGLALWQQRRVTDLLLDALDADTSLAELASVCGLSAGHFTKAFRQSFGLPPHRWLLQQRALRASEMIRDTKLQLDQIAIACGFVDQSHMSRVFRSVLGMTPGVWRRSNRS